MNQSIQTQKRPILGVSCLLLHDNHALLARRGKDPAKGLWSLPGGKLEWGETLEGAVTREISEETGIIIANPLFAEFVEIIQDDHHFVIAVFIIHLAERGELVAGDDVTDARWFSFSQIQNLDDQEQMTDTTAARIFRLSTLF